MKKTTLLVIFLLSFNVFAATSMSNRIAAILTKYASAASYPIIIFDRDELGWRFAREDAFEQSSRQVGIIQRYVQEVSGVELSADGASFLVPYITQLKDFAMAQPFIKDSDYNFAFCVAFPSSPNSNQRILHERIMGMNTAGVYQGKAFDQLQSRMGLDALLNFSIFHELSHCLDSTYIKKSMKWVDASLNVHQAEGFADTLALLLLEKDGYSNLGELRAEHRAIYSRMMGPYLASHSSLGMGNPHFEFGGAIYYLSPMLMATQYYIDHNQIDSYSINQLSEVASDIIEENTPDSRSFMAIANLLRNDMDETLETYKGYSEDWPQMFETPYQVQLEYLDNTDNILAQSFGEAVGPVPIGDTLLDLDLIDFCKAFNQNDKEAFFERLDLFRKDLQVFSTSELFQYQRAIDLDNIFSDIAATCRLRSDIKK